MVLTDSLNIDVDVDINNDTPFTCPICMNETTEDDKCITECNHVFCKDCIHKWLSRNKFSCPSCRGEINYYMNNLEKNNILRVNISANRDPVQDNNEITALRNRIHYYHFLLCINFLYTVYTMTDGIQQNNQLGDYQSQLYNCTHALEETTIKYNMITHVIIYFKEQYLNCEIPTYFINQCVRILYRD